MPVETKYRVAPIPKRISTAVKIRAPSVSTAISSPYPTVVSVMAVMKNARTKPASGSMIENPTIPTSVTKRMNASAPSMRFCRSSMSFCHWYADGSK